jgi:hypothetical protein
MAASMTPRTSNPTSSWTAVHLPALVVLVVLPLVLALVVEVVALVLVVAVATCRRVRINCG